MNYYQEISLLSNADIGVNFLWQKVYQQIHFVLVGNKKADNTSIVGVAFPEYDANQYSLGAKLQILSEDEESLEQLQLEKWLNRLKDYVHICPIKTVPEKIKGHACFKHIKLMGNKEKLARRRAKRKKETLQQALAHFENFEEQQSKLPYINMTSQTNGHSFRLYVEKQETGKPKTGSYSCYGLSNTATVPLF